MLLVGNAAGLKNPLNGEGIHTALKSGLLAANSIVKATRTGDAVSKIYIGELSPLLAALHLYYARVEEIKVQVREGLQTIAVLTEAFEASVEGEKRQLRLGGSR